MFYDNYIRLCAEHGEKPTPVAQALGCTSSNVAQWKKGSTPRKPVLEKIAEHFGVPVQDLLFGDTPTSHTVFFERFTALCNSEGIAPNAVAKELKIPSGSITAWGGTSIPRLSTIKKIADRFGVSVSYLAGESDTQTPPTLNEQGEEGLAPEVRALINDLIAMERTGQIDEAGIDFLRSSLNLLKAKNEQK